MSTMYGNFMRLVAQMYIVLFLLFPEGRRLALLHEAEIGDDEVNVHDSRKEEEMRVVHKARKLN